MFATSVLFQILAWRIAAARSFCETCFRSTRPGCEPATAAKAIEPISPATAPRSSRLPIFRLTHRRQQKALQPTSDLQKCDILRNTLAYLIIVAAAILEGEIYYSKVCADAVSGRLNWVGVWLAGALGGSAGDQIWFYALRGRIHWIDRFPRLARHRDTVSARVHSHETPIVLASRFLPGLRVAIPVACAYAGTRPLKFTLLNMASALGWAGSILLLVALGSQTLVAFGLNRWWGPLIPAVMVMIFFRWLGRKGPGSR
jgi:membrane protein DedA with SNARE-associated domain